MVRNELAFAVFDAFPVSEGHSLVIPRRHVSDFFELAPAEISAVFELVQVTRKTLEERHRPAGYNLGVNIGCAAGQTVMHAHIHLIPRYPGDVAEAAGGVRNVFPDKGRY